MGTGLFQYFIRIIPTVFVGDAGERIETNQYTFTERFRPVMLPGLNGAAPVQVRACRCGFSEQLEVCRFLSNPLSADVGTLF